MTTKLKVLVGLMALSLAGGAGGVFALTRSSATQTGTAGAFDKAIYLYWGSEASTANLNTLDNLVASTPKYNYLSVTPKSSASVSGTVTLTFTLSSGGANTHMEGLTVSVYKTASLTDDEHVEAAIGGLTPTPVLTKDSLSGTTTFSVAQGAGVHETNAYYAIKVVWSGAIDTDHPENPMSATLTISQSFGA